MDIKSMYFNQNLTCPFEMGVAIKATHTSPDRHHDLTILSRPKTIDGIATHSFGLGKKLVLSRADKSIGFPRPMLSPYR